MLSGLLSEDLQSTGMKHVKVTGALLSWRGHQVLLGGKQSQSTETVKGLATSAWQRQNVTLEYMVMYFTILIYKSL